MSNPPPVLIAMAPCHVHGGVFAFDPDQVQSVLIDPETGRPPDVDEAGYLLPPDPSQAERIARSVRRPICPACCKMLNEAARLRGLPAHFDETDTSGGQVQR